MVYYYEKINHTNTSDSEERILTITSTTEEKKRIVSLISLSEELHGVLRGYVEREKIFEYPSGYRENTNPFEVNVDIELKEGEEFKLTLQNEVAGNNASFRGMVKYQIV